MNLDLKFLLILFSLFIFTNCKISSPGNIDKPIIVISFDDQHCSTYDIALPIMMEFSKKYNKIIVGSNTVNSNLLNFNYEYYFTWEQLIELEKNYNWETFAHSLNHNDLTFYTYQEFIDDIDKDLDNFHERGIFPKGFSLPAGHATIWQREYIKSKFDFLRNSLDKRMKYPINEYNLGYFFYSTEYSYKNVINRIIDGTNNREDLIILGFHRISDTNIHNVDVCKIKDFRTIVKFLCDNNYEIMTIENAIKKINYGKEKKI